MKSKQKIKNTWNHFDKVGVKYDDGTIDFIDYPWYFAVSKTDAFKARDLLQGYAVSMSSNQDFPDFIKIFCKTGRTDERAGIVMLLEENGIETYEGDLMLDRRFYIDSEIEISQKYKKLYFDIETDDTNEKIVIGKDRILSYAAIDSDGKIYFEELKSFTDKGERDLLLKFLKMIKNYDILLGWNSSQFDIPYLKDRMRMFNLHKTDDYCWRELAHFDLLKRFRHIFRFDNHIKSFALEYVSKHFLDESKVSKFEKTIELWKTDREKLKQYNIQDSILVKKLDEELEVSDMMMRQSSWCGVPISHFGLYSIIDAYIMRCAHRAGKYVRTSVRTIKERSIKNERGNVDPSNTKDYASSEDEANYLGAIVLDPVIGKYDNVYTFDFKGLYPSLMRTSNIGYDTLRNEADVNRITNPGTSNIQRMTGTMKPTYFDKDKSVINIAITELITKRSEYKKLKLKMIEEGKDKGPKWERIVSDEIIVKELANSTYGIMGLQYGRYFSVDVAESITLFGQWCINYAKSFFENTGHQVIYGDTDSVFVVASETFDLESALKKFHESLKEELKKYNIEESYIQLEFDKHYKNLLLVNKKNYAGHVVNIEGKKTDQIYIRGLDCIKKSTFSFAASKQKELIGLVLKTKMNKEDFQQWVKKTRDEFLNKDFKVEEVTISHRLGKHLNDYKRGSELHVRLAKQLYERTGEFQINREVEYVITGSKNNRLEGVLTIDYDGRFDRGYYWTNKTVPVLERIISVIYPNSDFFIPQKKLEI